jgi:hypothetical protein
MIPATEILHGAALAGRSDSGHLTKPSRSLPPAPSAGGTGGAGALAAREEAAAARREAAAAKEAAASELALMRRQLASAQSAAAEAESLLAEAERVRRLSVPTNLTALARGLVFRT